MYDHDHQKQHDHPYDCFHDEDLHFLLLVELLVRHDGGGGVVGGLLVQIHIDIDIIDTMGC